jgi:DNA-binding response OmpR family regulator
VKKILIVDDEVNIRRLYEAELAGEGYEVLKAADAAEAIRLFRSESPDLVVLDIRLPDRDGLDVLTQMISERRQAHIVLNSAYPAFRSDFHSWAADAYLVKSSDLTELRDTIRSILFPGRRAAQA